MSLYSRRSFFRQAGAGAAAFTAVPLWSGAAPERGRLKRIGRFFSKPDVLLFQGDSITDAGRNKEQEPPDVLSILIGGNDYWHMRNGMYDGTWEVYENDSRALLQRTTAALPDIRLVICQPFILPDTGVVDESWLQSVAASV
jgi:hypothetical protein